MIYLFEDNHSLSPLTDTRLSGEIRVGIYSAYEYIEKYLQEEVTLLSKREYLFDTTASNTSQETDGEEHIFINARILPQAETLKNILEILSVPHRQCLWQDNVLIACKTQYKESYTFENFILSLDGNHDKNIDEINLIQYPWDVVIQSNLLLEEHLELRIEQNKLINFDHNVLTEKNVTIHPTAILDATQGKIIIEEGTNIGPYAILEGPLWIGENSTVKPHAQIQHCSLGNHTKTGGEISHSLFYDYSNKQHFGFIGHSVIGSWVNLGGGTSNSNLKNTYGTIRMNYNEQKIETEQMFLGCVIGDHSKTAINTSIYTGKIIGTNCHIFGNVLENVPSFTMYYKGIGMENKICTLKSALITQKRVFARRGKEQTEADKKALKTIYEK